MKLQRALKHLFKLSQRSDLSFVTHEHVKHAHVHTHTHTHIAVSVDDVDSDGS